MRTYKTEGIILKRRNLGEGDRILTVLSKNNGKIHLKAPGVRKITSRRSPHIELLNLSQLTIYRSPRIFLPIVTEAHALEDFSAIKEDLRKIGYAYYICELTNGLCPDNQENRGVFSLLRSTLFELCDSLDSKKVVKYFERELLNNLGFWLEANLLRTRDSQDVMERILEKKLKTSRLLHLFIS